MNRISIEDFHQLILDKGVDNLHVIDVRTPENLPAVILKVHLIYP